MSGSGSITHAQNSSRSGAFSDTQNASAVGVGHAAHVTSGSFHSGGYSLGSGQTVVHVNTSGTGTGLARLAVGCSHVPGTATASFNYSLTIGLFDRTTSKWVGERNFVFFNLSVSVDCAHGSPVSRTQNLTLGWSIGDFPSPIGVNPTDSLQIVTGIHVLTAALSTGAAWAYSAVTLDVHLLRMQGYSY